MLTDKQIEQLAKAIKQNHVKVYDLRKQIRNDVEEYNLFRQTPYIAGDKFNFYREYLLEQIDMNIAQLKELMEQNNE